MKIFRKFLSAKKKYLKPGDLNSAPVTAHLRPTLYLQSAAMVNSTTDKKYIQCMDGFLRKKREEYGCWSCPHNEGRDGTIGEGISLRGGEVKEKQTQGIKDAVWKLKLQ